LQTLYIAPQELSVENAAFLSNHETSSFESVATRHDRCRGTQIA
jgi:hypothetical protein